MKSLLFQQSFESLSIRDLLKARDLFHYQLINKENVVATAIGLYRIRKEDPWPSAKDRHVTGKKGRRTLGNSEIRPYSWPCVYVFVEQWEDENQLMARDPHSLIPKTLYLPDGQMVPVCIIEAKRELAEADLNVDAVSLTPENFLAPGTLLINNDGQGLRRTATAGCMVRDGQHYYILTNNHSLGATHQPINAFTRHGSKKIGTTASKNICRLPVGEVYPGFVSTNQYLQMDIGLVEVDDVLAWKTAVPGLAGDCGDVVDLYDQNLSLRLIGHKVVGKGGVSGMIRGEVQGLFYRYKAMGGYEYLCDFLIGPESDANGGSLKVRHGDSGTVLYVEQVADRKQPASKVYFPLAVIWGRHQFQDGLQGKAEPFAMATALSTVLNILDLDYVADINSDESFIWGYIGHYAIGRQLSDAVGLIKDAKLKTFILANSDKISMKAADIRSVAKSPRPLDGDGDSFVPLADVPDNVWKGNVNFKTTKLPDGSTKREQGPGSRNRADNPNHFADIDLPFTGGGIAGIDGKTLLQLSLADPDTYLKPDFWLKFYEAPGIKGEYERWHKEQADPSKEYRPDARGSHWGALPFRVWQLYDIMVKAAQNNKPDEFLCAGGVLVHYLGDACQPLHCSYKSQGDPNALVDYTKKDGTEMKKMEADGVHSGYEDEMVNAPESITKIMDGLPTVIAGQTDLIPAINNGFDAAKALIALVVATQQELSPQRIIDKWVAVKPLKKAQKDVAMWADLGEATIACMARGSRYLAAIWDSAWQAGGHNKITTTDVSTAALQKLYESPDFAKSVPLDKYHELLGL